VPIESIRTNDLDQAGSEWVSLESWRRSRGKNFVIVPASTVRVLRPREFLLWTRFAVRYYGLDQERVDVERAVLLAEVGVCRRQLRNLLGALMERGLLDEPEANQWILRTPDGQPYVQYRRQARRYRNSWIRTPRALLEDPLLTPSEIRVYLYATHLARTRKRVAAKQLAGALRCTDARIRQLWKLLEHKGFVKTVYAHRGRRVPEFYFRPDPLRVRGAEAVLSASAAAE